MSDATLLSPGLSGFARRQAPVSSEPMATAIEHVGLGTSRPFTSFDPWARRPEVADDFRGVDAITPRC